MKKAEVIRYMKTMRKAGYITHTILLDIFSEDENIPDDMVDLLCHRPGPPQQCILMGSEALIKELNNRVDQYIQTIKT